MEISLVVVCLSALGASVLTFFSGFGLGTLLMPVLAIFFPLETAVVMTALVHFVNNLFKFGFLWKQTQWHVVRRFGLPAFLAALLGAKCLILLGNIPVLGSYSFCGRIFFVTPLKLAISSLIVIFVLWETGISWRRIQFSERYLELGGVVSGFLGGVSGHQGALRSAFLINMELPKEAFLATGVAIACLVDVSRIFVYVGLVAKISWAQTHWNVLAGALAASFLGVVIGARLLKKVTLPAIQRVVSGLLLLIAGFLAFGIV